MYSERELQSRYVIFCEKYVKEVTIEASMMIMMAKTMILPAALRYQGEVATSGERDQGGGRGCCAPSSSICRELTDVDQQVPGGLMHQLDEGAAQSRGWRRLCPREAHRATR